MVSVKTKDEYQTISVIELRIMKFDVSSNIFKRRFEYNQLLPEKIYYKAIYFIFVLKCQRKKYQFSVNKSRHGEN